MGDTTSGPKKVMSSWGPVVALIIGLVTFTVGIGMTVRSEALTAALVDVKEVNRNQDKMDMELRARIESNTLAEAHVAAQLEAMNDKLNDLSADVRSLVARK